MYVFELYLEYANIYFLYMCISNLLYILKSEHLYYLCDYALLYAVIFDPNNDFYYIITIFIIKIKLKIKIDANIYKSMTLKIFR